MSKRLWQKRPPVLSYDSNLELALWPRCKIPFEGVPDESSPKFARPKPFDWRHKPLSPGPQTCEMTSHSLMMRFPWFWGGITPHRLHSWGLLIFIFRPGLVSCLFYSRLKCKGRGEPGTWTRSPWLPLPAFNPFTSYFPPQAEKNLSFRRQAIKKSSLEIVNCNLTKWFGTAWLGTAGHWYRYKNKIIYVFC